MYAQDYFIYILYIYDLIKDLFTLILVLMNTFNIPNKSLICSYYIILIYKFSLYMYVCMYVWMYVYVCVCVCVCNTQLKEI